MRDTALTHWIRSAAALVPAATIALAPACSRHIELNAPDRSAADAERIEAYERLAAVGKLDSVEVDTRTWQPIERSTQFIVLGDGRRVYHADDLLPVVEPGSPTARAAQASRRARRHKRAWGWAALGSLVVGTALVTAGVASAGPPDWEPDLGLVAGGGGLYVLSAPALLVGYHYARNEKDERVSAFSTYDRSLRTRLDLCVDGTRVVACSSASGRASAGAERP